MEIWKDIEGFEGLYQVSDAGQVKSVQRVIQRSTRPQTVKEKILSANINEWGYVVAQLYRNGKGRSFVVHRLMATAFFKKPQGKDFVNHKDGNKQNNSLSNLEWCTTQENIRHAFDMGLSKPTTLWKEKNPMSKRVIDSATGIIYPCANEVARVFGIKRTTLTAQLCGQSKNNTTFKYL